MLVLAACTHERIATRAVELAHASASLHARGEADVMTWSGITPRFRAVSAHDVVEATLDPTAPRPVRISVAELLADCPTTAFALDGAVRARYPRCALFAAADRPIVVADVRHSALRSGHAWALLSVAATTGLVACTISCRSPWSYVTGGVLVVSVVGTALVTALVIDIVKHRKG